MNSKRNKYFLTLMTCSWCLLSWLAHADTTLSANAKQLGIAESVLHYCGSVDPAVAGKLNEKIKELIKGLSTQQVAELRQSAEYQAAYSSMEEFVGKVDEHNAKQVCSESVSPRK